MAPPTAYGQADVLASYRSVAEFDSRALKGIMTAGRHSVSDPKIARGPCVTTQRSEYISPEKVYGELKKNGVTHVVMLPDSETNFLYTLMKSDPDLTVIAAAREGQCLSTAAGLSVGGKKPVVLIQNTGMLESCDSIRGWGLTLKTPVVMMIGYRGWTRHGVNPASDVANFTEPVLHALGIHYFLVESDDDMPRISLAFQEAEQTRRPVAILVGDEYHGFNR